MTATHVIFRREMRMALTTVFVYVKWAAFLAASGWSLVEALRRGEGGFVQVPALWAGTVAFWLPFLSTFATMQSFSTERASGTLETLLTAPVRESQVVWGKFHAAFMIGMVGLLLALLAPVLLLPRLAPLLTNSLSAWALLAAGLVLIVQLALWTAVGLFFSLLWEQQAAAAACSLFFCLLLPRALAAAAAAWFPTAPLTTLGLSARAWAMDVASGLVTVSPLVCFSVVTWVFLLLSTLLLEARQIRTG